jgi:hypothetical protein
MYTYYWFLTGTPTLQEFISFPMASGKVNLAERIGTNYKNFGISLLDDDVGDRTETIEKEHREKAMDINREVFRQWLKGTGLQPVSWATLVRVLQDIQLKKLADDIRQVKCPES